MKGRRRDIKKAVTLLLVILNVLIAGFAFYQRGVTSWSVILAAVICAVIGICTKGISFNKYISLVPEDNAQEKGQPVKVEKANITIILLFMCFVFTLLLTVSNLQGEMTSMHQNVNQEVNLCVPKESLKIDINEASIAELSLLRGVGEVIAGRIVAYRKLHKFKETTELINVEGIGENLYQKIKGEVVVNKCLQQGNGLN